jgi:hypothetical protein
MTPPRAQEHKRAHEEEQRRLHEENLKLQERIKAAHALTDDDISDEPVFAMKKKLDAEKKAKHEAEQKRLREENSRMKEKLSHVVAKTDDDLDDDEAGAARKLLAAQHKAQHEAEQQRLHEENLRVRQGGMGCVGRGGACRGEEGAGMGQAMGRAFGAGDDSVGDRMSVTGPALVRGASEGR